MEVRTSYVVVSCSCSRFNSHGSWIDNPAIEHACLCFTHAQKPKQKKKNETFSFTTSVLSITSGSRVCTHEGKLANSKARSSLQSAQASSSMQSKAHAPRRRECKRFMVHHHQGGSCRYTSRVPPSLQQWLNCCILQTSAGTVSLAWTGFISHNCNLQIFGGFTEIQKTPKWEK